MSKPTSAGAPERDWAKLLQQATENNRLLTQAQLSLWEQERLEGDDNVWGRDYVSAMQAALDHDDAERLLKMLDAGLPVPRILLPVLADVLRSAQQGNGSGRATKLTADDEGNLRFLFDVMTAQDRKRPAEVRRWLLKSYREKLKDPRLSISTLNRALRRNRQPARFMMLPAIRNSSKAADRPDREHPVEQALFDYGSRKPGA